MSYSVYVIKSEKDGRLYVGMSSRVDERLKEHNNGNTFSTKGYRPWKIVYVENCGDRITARRREKYLKSGCGKEFLKATLAQLVEQRFCKP